MKNKFLSPYTIKTESTYGFSNSNPLEENTAISELKRLVQHYKDAGYTQVKEGAYLFIKAGAWENLTISIKCFNADNKLVTHELITKE